MDKLITLQNLKQKIAAELDRRPAEDRDAAISKMAARNRLKVWFPDEGPLRRELYVKHVQFLNAGAPTDCLRSEWYPLSRTRLTYLKPQAESEVQ